MGNTTTTTWRTLLVLGRVSNLPTVWSNCLAGWLLAGGGEIPRLLILCAGASLLYVAGMYLNDAFDAGFDREHRANRPIPNGQIAERTVWLTGFILLAAGGLVVGLLGRLPGLLGIALIGSILVYDAFHKAVSYGPVLMALCRVFLMVLAASVGSQGITGLSVWSAVALGCWIIGLSYLARRESFEGAVVHRWPLLALGVPVFLAQLVNPGDGRWRASLLCVVVLLWAWRCVRFSFPPPGNPRQIGRTVSGLLAGICLVDLLAVAPGFIPGLVFAALFGLSLLFQRHVPAT